MVFSFDNKIKQALGKSKKKAPQKLSQLSSVFNKTIKKPVSKAQSIKPSIINTPLKSVQPRLGITQPRLFKTDIKGASPLKQKQWKSFSSKQRNMLRKVLPDRDGDRIPDMYDCSPRNIMRQDDDEVPCKNCGGSGICPHCFPDKQPCMICDGFGTVDKNYYDYEDEE